MKQGQKDKWDNKTDGGWEVEGEGDKSADDVYLLLQTPPPLLLSLLTV